MFASVGFVARETPCERQDLNVSTTLLQRFIFFALVPAVACAVAIRQAYLSKFDELSTWKGGGMGMFASADSTDTRFLRFYIEKPDGRREPIIGLTERQKILEQRALWYPRLASIEPLAVSLRRTGFVAANEPSQLWAYADTGEALKPLDRKHYLLRANLPRPGADDPDWTLVIESYRVSYDPTTKRAGYKLVKSWNFPKRGAE